MNTPMKMIDIALMSTAQQASNLETSLDDVIGDAVRLNTDNHVLYELRKVYATLRGINENLGAMCQFIDDMK